MAFPTSHLIEYCIYDGPFDDQHHQQVLEIRRRFIHCLMFESSFQIVHQTSPISLDNNNVLFPLPLYLLHDHEPISFPIYIAQLLSSRNIDLDASEVIAGEIALVVNEVTRENPNASFHVVAIIDYVQFTWMESSSFPMQPSTENRVRMEKLEEIGEDLGDCSICLEEFCSNERKVVKIQCGHVYHESCILKWLDNSHSCPLCRSPILPLED